jgi:hypothetical protein
MVLPNFTVFSPISNIAVLTIFSKKTMRITVLFLLGLISTSISSNPLFTPFFKQAYELNPKVPKGILEAVAFSNTRIEHITHTSEESESCVEIPNAYGVMGLTLNGKNYFRNNLKLISEISLIDQQSIITLPEKNIMAYAKAYTSMLDIMHIKSMNAADHVPVLVALSELPFDGDLQNDFALNSQLYSIFSFLNNKEYQTIFAFPSYEFDLVSIFGEQNYQVLSAPGVVINGNSIQNNSGSSYSKSSISTQIMSIDYGPAIWNPTSCNFSSRNGTAISAVTVHTVQGSYAGCISWFKNCSSNVSAHYVIRSSDGQVTQMVLEINKAWHVGNHNPYTIGLEHEGYINNAAWYTNAMYVSSANLVKDICLSGYGIQPTSCYNGPSCTGGSNSCLISTTYKIKGHQHFSSQSHTDPGINWDWPKYYCLINNCGQGPVNPPPPPSVSTNLCGDKTLTRSTPPSGITYYWQGTSCGTSTVNSALSYIATVSGTYFLRARDNSTNVWSSTCSSVAVTVNPIPANPSAPGVSSSTCGLTVLTRSTSPSGITYFWQGTSCATNTANSSVNYSVTAGGNYYLRARSAAGCWSTGCSSIAVNVTAAPVTPPVPSISSNSCGNKTLTRATPPSGTTYFWQGTACGTSTNNSALTYTVGVSGTYYLRAFNATGCWSNCSSIAVNISPCPGNLAASVGGPCPTKTVDLSWNNSGGTWTVEVSLDPAFASAHSKTVSNVSNISAPASFSPSLVWQPNATYYWRLTSGGTVLNGPVFTIPFCDLTNPTTSISPVNGWQNTSFTVNFSDNDNISVARRFYNVNDYNGSEWRANGARGFFNDNFDAPVIHSDWQLVNGTWQNTAGNLVQSDNGSLNTNMSAAITQSLSNRYLYHWTSRVYGTGTGKKGGLHFFASSATSVNRGTSYLVITNIDNGRIEFYKSINDVMSLVKQSGYNFIIGQFYDFKVVYDRILGKMDVYVNDVLEESWVDANPIATGNYISLRTENASMDINFIEVLRTRTSTVTVNAGTSPNDDIRYQNAGPNIHAGKILSLATDAEGNISSPESIPVNIDWTPPAAPQIVNDGTGADINTTFLTNQLSANWSIASDQNSGITNYYYSIGTNPGDTSICGWTNNNLQMLAIKNTLSLTLNQVYYFNIKVKNGADLYSPITSSNGQTVVVNPIGIDELNNVVSSLIVYPNPFSENATLEYSLMDKQDITITLTDILGREVGEWVNKAALPGNYRVNINSQQLALSRGIYLVRFKTESSSVSFKLILDK